MSYVDLQVNGAYGVDFNDDELTFEAFVMSCQRLRNTGVVTMLPTIITDSLEAMCSRIAKIAAFLDEEPTLKSLVRGIHVEGPFLSNRPGFCGTHPPQHIRPAEITPLMRLLDAGQGLVRMVTLAPEQDSKCQTIERLRRENIIVFAGHTDASHVMLQRAIEAGLVGFTHLGNGCVQQVDRHDNIIQRVLALKDHLVITLIADGIHLPEWLLQSWLNIIGFERSIVISDAMSAAGMPPGEYKIGGQPIQVDASRRTTHRDHGYLAGSASTMFDMDQMLVGKFGLSDHDRTRVMHTNALRLLNTHGCSGTAQAVR
jgi:N-acetylglucosamine-6-phosphate deacetylase